MCKQLYKGDNLTVLQYLCDNGYRNKVDLVYIDPPFATNNTFTFSNEHISTVSNSKSDTIAYTDLLKGNEFISFLRDRLVLLKELLSPVGSIYLHTDYKIGHYVKVLMDEVFGIKNFRNDITRIKCTTKSFSRSAYGNIKDLILFYTKTENSIWNEPREELDEVYLSKQYNKIDSYGRAYGTVPLTAPGESNGITGKPWKGVKLPKGRHWTTTPDELNKLDEQGLIEWSRTGNPRKIIYRENAVERGKKVQDVWEYKDPQYPKYPTEKNVGLLKRIIGASSDKDSLVLDCFCGGGGTLVISEIMQRNWIGVDKSDMAIQVTKERLKNECNLNENNYKYIEM